jgi:beta-lactamase regulating signal transducer with metallopeptidase domain
MDVYLSELVRYLARQSWQIAVLALAVATVTWALRHRTAHVRYLLWLIVLAKCLVPPYVAVPLKILPEKSDPVATVAVPIAEPVTSEPAAVDYPAPARVSRPAPGPVRQAVATNTKRTAWRPWSFAAWAGLTWMGGASLLLALNLLRALRGQHWLRQRRRPLPGALRQEMEALLSACGRSGLPAIWIVDGIGQPFVWGLACGSIYVPASFLRIRDAAQRRHVLAHELSHVRRCDAAVNLLQTIAQGLFWFHPFVWWANRQIRREREKCCDEMAVAQLGTQARDYCNAVVETLASAETSGRPIPSLAVAGPVRNLEERIRTMLRPGKRFYSRPSGIAAIVVGMAAFLIVPTAIALTPRGNPPGDRESNTVAAEAPDEAGHAGDTGGQTSVPPHTRDAVSREKLNEILNAMLHHDTAIMPIAMHVDIEMWSFDPESQWQHNEIYSFEQRLDGRRIDSIMTRYRIEDGQPRHIQDNRRVFTGSQFVYRQQQDGATLYPPEEAQRVMAYYHLWGGVLFGHLRGDQRPVAAMLQDSADVALHERTENVDGTACYVIEGRTNHGTYQLWVDPEHGYRIRRSIVDKGPGDMFFGKPMSAEAGENRPTPASTHMEISDVTLEKIGDHFIPTAETMTFKMVRTNGTEYRSKMVVKRSDIDLRPDFEALEAFVIPDGTRLTHFDPNSHIYAYEWHDGKAVSIAPGGGIVRGRVRFTGHADLDTVLKGKRKLHLHFWSMPTTEQEREQPTSNSMEVRLEKDGSFYVEDIPVGRYHLHVSFTEPKIEEGPSGSLRTYIVEIPGVDRQLLMLGEMEIAGVDREFSILEESDQAKPQTVDLGVLEMAVEETPEPPSEAPEQSSGAEPEEGRRGKTLRFPSDRSVGHLQIQEAGATRRPTTSTPPTV